MKSIIVTLALAAVTLIGTTTGADARHYASRTYVSSYRSCGTPVYTERYFVGYDRCGAPVWGYRTVRSSYRPVVRARYQAPCPPPVHYGHGSGYRRGYSGGRVVIQGSIYR